MKNKKLFGALASILAIGILTGCNKDDGSEEELTVKEIPVEIESVSYGALSDSNRLTGTIIPEVEVDVMPKAPGEIKTILVNKGAEVKVGDILAQLDDVAERNAVSQQEAMLKQSQSGLKSAQSSLSSAQSGLNSAQSGKGKAEQTYAQSQAGVRQGEASLAEARKSQNDNLDNIGFQVKNAQNAWDQAKQNLSRMKALHEEGLATKQNYEDAIAVEKNAKVAYDQVVLNKSQAGSDISLRSLEAALDQTRIGTGIAQSSIQEAVNGIAQAQATVGQAQAGVEQAQAAVDQAQLGVDAAKDKLADKVIVATGSGEITELNGEIGSMATGQTVFAKIVSINKVKISVSVVPDQLVGLAVGTQVDIEVSGRKEPVSGVVSYVSVVGSESGLFTVEAEIDNTDHKLLPGTVATIMLEEVLEEDALLVPTNAIIQKEGKSVVFSYVDGMVFPKEVEVLRYGADFAAIEGDIKDKDQVVTKGQNLLDEGDLVKIVGED